MVRSAFVLVVAFGCVSLVGCNTTTGEGVSGCHGNGDCPAAFPICRSDMRCWSTTDAVDANIDANGLDGGRAADTGVTHDSGIDTGASSVDSGMPGNDAGTTELDAGGGTDSGSLSMHDTGPAPVDSGTAGTDAGLDGGGACGGGPMTTFYRDADADGHGAASSGTMLRCSAGGGYVASNDDCNDTNVAIHPGATELCNGVDDDCDGTIDGTAADANCPLAHATARCTAASCAIASCGTGFDDCDGVASTGCEADLVSSPTNCGACFQMCGVAATCAARACDTTLVGLLGTGGLGAQRGICAVRSTGRVACWGAGLPGGTYRPAEPTASLPQLTNVLATNGAWNVVGGLWGIVHTDGTVSCYGSNESGQFGNGTTVPASGSPIWGTYMVTDAVQVAAGTNHTCVRRRGGVVTCAGANNIGQLGDGTNTPHATPATVSGLADAVDIASTSGVVCAVRASGQVVCWGSDFSSFSSTTPTRTVPWWSATITDALQVEFSGFVACVARSGGRVDCATGTVQAPITVPGGVVEMVSGQDHMCAVNPTGEVYCWGTDNGVGQLGNGSSTYPGWVASRVVGLGTVVRVAAAMTTTCALETTGTVRCWGNCEEMGDGRATCAPTSNPTPVVVTNLP